MSKRFLDEWSGLGITLLAFAFFGLYSGWNRFQWEAGLGIQAGLAAHWFLGTALLKRFFNGSLVRGLYLPILVGEVLLFGILWFLSFPLRTAAYAVGFEPGLVLVVYLSVAGALTLLLGKRKGSVLAFFNEFRAELCSPLGASGWLVLSIGAAFFAGDLGAPGHDGLHQVFWARQIVSEGFVSLRAWHTDWLDSYPRGFALLVAQWDALSFSALLAGPFCRVQPFLQMALAIFAAGDLALSTLKDKKAGQVGQFFATVLVLVATLSWFQVVMPETIAFNGIGRLSTSFLHALPILLAFHLLRRPSAAGFAFFVFMFLAIPGILLLINPATFVQYWFIDTAFCGPVVCFLPSKSLFSRATFRACVCAGVVVGAMWLGDPWVLNRLADSAPWTANTVQALTGARPLFFAEHGVASVYPDKAVSLSCESWSCLTAIARTGLSGMFAFLGASWMPWLDRSQLVESRKYVYWGTVFVLFLFVVFFRLRRIRKAEFLPLALIVSGVLLSAWVSRFIPCALFGLKAQGELFLLADYTNWTAVHWSPFDLSLLWLALYVACFRPRSLVPRMRSWGKVEWSTVLAVLLALQLSSRKLPGSFQPGIRPIPWEEVQILRRLEKQVLYGEVVAIPVDYVRSGEKWIYPTDKTRELAPLSKVPILFNYFMGPGITVSHSGVQHALCGSSDEARRAYLKERGVHYFYFFDEDSGTRTFFDKRRICGVPLKKFGLVFPPIFSEADQTLYRITY